jgi:hypothetical protein
MRRQAMQGRTPENLGPWLKLDFECSHSRGYFLQEFPNKATVEYLRLLVKGNRWLACVHAYLFLPFVFCCEV